MRLWRLFLLWFLAVAAAAAPAAAQSSSNYLLSLQQQIASLLSSKSADVGIAALDLSTGTGISVHGNDPYPMASTVKVAVAATYLREVEAGRRSLSDTIQGHSADWQMHRMIIYSDNHAADALINNLGGPQTIEKWLEGNGIKGIHVDRTIAELLRAKRDLWDRRDSATPLAMVDLLRRIDNGELLDSSSRSYLLGLMRACETGKNRIKWLLPAGTPVQHKTGTLNGLADDVGYITLPDGRRIAVAVFARGGENRPRTIAEAARAVYDGFLSAVTYPFSATLGGR